MTELAPFPDASQEVLAEITNEYAQSLIIPEIKSVRQWMLMPVGLIGSGKSTVVKPLSERLNLVRLNTDDVRKLLKERKYSYEGARDIILNLVKSYLKLGYSLAIDANNGSTFGLDYNARTKKEFPDVQQIFVHIDPSEEYIINKLKNHRPTWLFKNGDAAVEAYFKNKKDFTMPNLHFVYTFDPSRSDLEKQLEEGIHAIEKELNLLN
jgi:hypothetical protein